MLRAKFQSKKACLIYATGLEDKLYVECRKKFGAPHLGRFEDKLVNDIEELLKDELANLLMEELGKDA